MSFIRSGSKLGAVALSDDQLSRIAPSIFAQARHDSRSARYSYIPTSEILAGMRAEGFLPTFAKQGGSRVVGKAAFTKHLIRFRRVDQMAIKPALGALYPEVVLINSHDGTSAYQVSAGLMRLVCLNGMLVADKEFASVRVPHKGDVMGQVIEGSFTVLDESTRALDVAESWAGVTLSREESMIMAESAHMIRFADAEGKITTPIQPAQLLHARRADDRGSDLWTINNVLQENAIKGGQTAWGRDAHGKQRRTTSREVGAIDQDVKINRALWHLATEMAKLKGVYA
jgi:hypothetical protein